jgi:uncharacterized membrane protein (DUF106 family)
MATVAQMARDDTKWFVVGVVVLSIVLFLALPITALMMIDEWKMRQELKQEIRHIKKLEQELKEQKDSK